AIAGPAMAPAPKKTFNRLRAAALRSAKISAIRTLALTSIAPCPRPAISPQARVSGRERLATTPRIPAAISTSPAIRTGRWPGRRAGAVAEPVVQRAGHDL